MNQKTKLFAEGDSYSRLGKPPSSIIGAASLPPQEPLLPLTSRPFFCVVTTQQRDARLPKGEQVFRSKRKQPEGGRVREEQLPGVAHPSPRTD
ncbi:hypothetical protein CEXT_654091 [Caerostris extrusa]|uniref:Uncharacterized protein n=1 Tax=Caerostris extrusa TaxID=172846 RepID=A0AAV4RZ80_CAEEX|nr:hypothetical protein CEXT_654091 [Caerostris extrusa]